MKKIAFKTFLVFLAFQVNAEVLTYKNPIIPGFNPDPSICRVEDNYYLVNSSFEWFPGIPIYHSKDLVNWKLIGYGITRADQVELPEGLKDSSGIYAVTIHYNEGIFYLITTCVNCKNNFYITSEDPAGEWSDPVWLHSPGIDPSLFWDTDGKCYYLGHANISGVNDWPEKNGVWMQELDLEQKQLVGKRVQLTHGHASNARWTEGPHLYKINDKYMLLVAEGGTGFHHSVTVFHSDKLWGPYIPEHSNPVLTHRHLGKDYPVHSVGHADIVKTQNGQWWAVMLGKRQFDGYTYLSRETFLTSVIFEGNTPVFNPGVGRLSQEQERPKLPWTPVSSEPAKDEFDSERLALKWNFLRTPYKMWYELNSGILEIQLRPQIICELTNPSFIAQRITDLNFTASTSMRFSTVKSNEMAGIAVYRKSDNHYQLMKDKTGILLTKTFGGNSEEVARVQYDAQEVFLAVKCQESKLFFMYGNSPNTLNQIGEAQDRKILSDEMSGGFNGPFIGLYATSNGKESVGKASFEWFEYKSLDQDN